MHGTAWGRICFFHFLARPELALTEGNLTELRSEHLIPLPLTRDEKRNTLHCPNAFAHSPISQKKTLPGEL